jgi:hypothetical protein
VSVILRTVKLKGKCAEWMGDTLGVELNKPVQEMG